MQTLNDYLAALASADPVPGGGSAAMIVGAAGCSLVAMVARICEQSRKYEPVHAAAADLAAKADALRERMLRIRTQDEAAYAGVVAARGDKEAMQRALERAASIPLEGARAGFQALHLTNDALALGNANLISDLGCAAEFAHAAIAACAYNVRINHKFMKDAQIVRIQAEALNVIECDAAAMLARIRDTVMLSLSKHG